MAAHLYWRIRILKSRDPSFNYCSLHEVEMRESVGGPDVITGGTASASSEYSGDPAGNAIDGDPATRWTSNNEAPCWWQYQFASAVDVVELAITAGDGGTGQTVDYMPGTFIVEWSDDGSEWFSARAFTEPAWSASETRTYTVADPVMLGTGSAEYTLAVTNGDAETGTMSGWTITDGGWIIYTNGPNSIDPGPYEGTRYFFAGTSNASTSMYQDLAVPAAAEADIDAGRGGHVSLNWRANTYDDTDWPLVTLRFLDGVGAEISASQTIECHTATGDWNLFELRDAVPVGTRTIRLELAAVRTSGTSLNAYVDAISDLTLRTGAYSAPVANGGAYGGSVASWTKVSGTGTLSVYRWDINGAKAPGSHYFIAGLNGACVYEQVTTVPAAAEADIDAGSVTAALFFLFSNYAKENDKGRINFRFLDASDVEISTHTGADLDVLRGLTEGGGFLDMVESAAVPTGTRKIAVQLESIYVSGTNSDAYFDEISDVYLAVGGAPAVLVDADLDLQWAINEYAEVPSDPLDLRWSVLAYVVADLQPAWRVGLVSDADTFGHLGVRGATYLEGNPAPTYDGERTGNPTATPVMGALGSPPTSTPAALGNVVLPQATGALLLHFAGDYYYRIWVIPDTITAQNPQLGVPIPFEIWNAYPWDNTLDAILEVGTTGLSLDLTAPAQFSEIELREVNITISPSAPIQIDAQYTFDFAEGSGVLYFTATIADFVQMVPAPPVTEHWDWLTDIITAWDSTEQRIALRAVPRRSSVYSFILDDERERTVQWGRLYKSLATRLVLPYYQYYTTLTQNSSPGEEEVYFNPDHTDVRDGEFVIVYDPVTVQGYLIKLGTVGLDSDGLPIEGSSVASPLTASLNAGWWIAPAFTSRIKDGSGLRMTSVAGEITIESFALDVRTSFKRPGSTAVINTFDGYAVLDQRPLANNAVVESFNINYEVIDSDTGLVDIKTAWPHPFVSGKRQFLVHRWAEEAAELDWWRDFLYDVRGQQNPFLLPTYREDLYAYATPDVGTAQLYVTNGNFADLYFPYPTYKRLQIELMNGTILWRTILQATLQQDGTTLLELGANFGVNPEDVDIRKISFLNLVRLGEDRVTLTHDYAYSTLELTVRTVDA